MCGYSNHLVSAGASSPLARTFARDDVALGEAFINGLRATLDEDMFATREIEAMLAAHAQMPQEILLKGDTHCFRGRRMLEQMIRAESASGPGVNPP